MRAVVQCLLRRNQCRVMSIRFLTVPQNPAKANFLLPRCTAPYQIHNDRWSHSRFSAAKILLELHHSGIEEFQEATSSATNFFRYTKLPRDSFFALPALARVISHKPRRDDPACFRRHDVYFKLINDIFFEVNTKLGGKLPDSFEEKRYLVDAGFHMRSVFKPYYRQLAMRWLHDVITECIYPMLEEGTLDRGHVVLATKCLVGLPFYKSGFQIRNPEFNAESIDDRQMLLRTLVEWYKRNHTRCDQRELGLFLHMLYRQAYSPSEYKQLRFLKMIVNDNLNMFSHSGALITLLKVDRLYRLLDSENFHKLREQIERRSELPYHLRTGEIDTMMRLCYMLAEKPFVKQHTVFFDRLADDIIRNYNSKSKSKHIAMLMKACLIANHRPPDVVVKKLCNLFCMTMHPYAYTEQLANMSKALVGMNMVHLGEGVIREMLRVMVERPAPLRSMVDLYVMKTIEIEHGDLLEEYFSREMFRLFQIHAHFKFLTDVVHFKVGMGSFYTEVLDEAIGRAYFTSTRVLPFFTDVDQMFMIDKEGNMLPAHEIRGTWEPLPQQYLAGKDLDTLQDIPDEAPYTGIEKGDPPISKIDLKFSVIGYTNKVKKIWSRRHGHIIYLKLTAYEDTGHRLGVCEWKHRLLQCLRPPVNVFEVDHAYIAHMCELVARGEDSVELREDCVNYIKAVVQYAITETMQRHKGLPQNENQKASLQSVDENRLITG